MKTLLLAGILLASSLNIFSAVRTWDGGGTDANWLTPANWVGDIAPVPNDDLVFPAAAAQFTTNNNFPFLTPFASITFEGGAYTLGGSLIRLANGITAADGAHAINFSVTLMAPQTFVATAPTATITILSASLGSFTLTIDGGGTIGFGLISGSGSITKNGAGAAAVIGSLGYSGPISVNNGIFVVDANIPNSPVTVNSASTGGMFGLSGLGGTGTVGAV